MEIAAEICCGGYEDALQADRGGARRVELNSALYLGGLTPGLGTLKLSYGDLHGASAWRRILLF